MNYIQLKDVSKYWGTTKAVENLNIEIKKGEFVIFWDLRVVVNQQP